jgi:hypothetical protein
MEENVPAKKNQAMPAKFALRMTATLGKEAKASAAREGVSLNQFINLAVAEKVEYLENEAWISRRRPITQHRIDNARALLHREGRASACSRRPNPRNLQNLGTRTGTQDATQSGLVAATPPTKTS